MSKPYITFHDIASIHLGPIRDFVKGDPCLTGEPFCTRRLVLTQKDGTAYHFSLYADRVEQLQVTVDAAVERHREPEPEVVDAEPREIDNGEHPHDHGDTVGPSDLPRIVR